MDSMTKIHEEPRYMGGQALLLLTLFLFAGSLLIVSIAFSLVGSQVKTMSELNLSLRSYQMAEAGLEDVVYRIKTGKFYSSTETLEDAGYSATVTTTDTTEGKDVLSVGNADQRIRKIAVTLIEGDGASFGFGVQTDVGGLYMENSSEVVGSVYSNGPIVGFNKNMVHGTAVSAGPSGSIYEVNATGSMYANELKRSIVGKNAYYQVIDALTEGAVSGTKYPGSPNLTTTSLPLTDAKLDEWETFAASSNVVSGSCPRVYNTDVSLGPGKIECDVEFSGNGKTITISGVLWIAGNLNVRQGVTIKVDPAIGNKSVPIIVHKPSNTETSSQVSLDNSNTWEGNGNRSYILVVSRNTSAEDGGSEKAIEVKNSAGGALLVYAGHGEILLRNNVDLTEITAYRVRTQNSSQVIYDQGLANAVFEGPGGSYVIDSWEEVE